jgi:hypothetical protein
MSKLSKIKNKYAILRIKLMRRWKVGIITTHHFLDVGNKLFLRETEEKRRAFKSLLTK